MKRMCFVLAVCGLLIFNPASLIFNPASAAMVEVYNQFDAIYEPSNEYVPNGVFGGTQNFSFRFGFIDVSHRFELTIRLPDEFIGTLYWGKSSELNGQGYGYSSGDLSAGESTTLFVGGVPSSSPTYPHYEALTFEAPDMPMANILPPSAVPVPPAFWLFGTGLLGLVGIARRKKATAV